MVCDCFSVVAGWYSIHKSRLLADPYGSTIKCNAMFFTTNLVACGTLMGRPYNAIGFCLNLQSAFHPIKEWRSMLACKQRKQHEIFEKIQLSRYVTSVWTNITDDLSFRGANVDARRHEKPFSLANDLLFGVMCWGNANWSFRHSESVFSLRSALW